MRVYEKQLSRNGVGWFEEEGEGERGEHWVRRLLPFVRYDGASIAGKEEKGLPPSVEDAGLYRIYM